MITAIISDKFTQIKRYKGRNKYELFLHNKPFRDRLQDSDLRLPDEELNFTVIPGKKLLSAHMPYMKLIQKLVAYIAERDSRLCADGPTYQALLSKAAEVRARYSFSAEQSNEHKLRILASMWSDFRSLSGI